MSSLSGIIQRPLVAAAVIAASVSEDVSEKFSSFKSLVQGSKSEQIAASISSSVQDERSMCVSQISASQIFLLCPVPNVDLLVPNPNSNLASSVTSLFALRSASQSAELAKASKPVAFTVEPHLWLLIFPTDGICLRLVQSICLVP